MGLVASTSVMSLNTVSCKAGKLSFIDEKTKSDLIKYLDEENILLIINVK
ncbi:hypothetical protein [Spiroplasma tabanidicola]|nr:hypothetical protein [Spiroplasma tabanidicola]